VRSISSLYPYKMHSQVVGPKRQKLKEAEEQMEVVMSALRTKQAELKEVMDKLAELDADLQVNLYNECVDADLHEVCGR